MIVWTSWLDNEVMASADMSIAFQGAWISSAHHHDFIKISYTPYLNTSFSHEHLAIASLT